MIRDDAQNGPDHADAHRTVAVCISPCTPGSGVDLSMDSATSMVRTMGLILNFLPLSRFDAAALPVYHSFRSAADLTPCTARPAQMDITEKNTEPAWGADISETPDFAGADEVDDILLGRIAWHAVRGPGVPMPPPAGAAFIFAPVTREAKKERPAAAACNKQRTHSSASPGSVFAFSPPASCRPPSTFRISRPSYLYSPFPARKTLLADHHAMQHIPGAKVRSSMHPSRPYRDPDRRWYLAGFTGISLPNAVACAVGLLIGRLLWSVAGALITQQSNRWMVEYFTGARPADLNLARSGMIEFLAQTVRFSSAQILLSVPLLILQTLSIGLLIATLVYVGDLLTRRFLHARLAFGGPTLEYRPLPPAPRLFAIAAIGFGFVAAMFFGIGAEFSSRVGLPMGRWMGFFPDSMHAVSITIGFALWCVLLRAPRWWVLAKAAQDERHRIGRTCFRCGYKLLGPAATTCPECGQIAPQIQPSPAPRSGARRAVLTAAILAAWCLAGAITGTLGVPAFSKAVYHTIKFDVLKVSPVAVLPPRAPTSSIMLPYSRPVRIQGPWGCLWLLALELPNHQMLVRAVLADSSGDAGEPDIQTIVFAGSGTMFISPRLGPKLHLLRTFTRLYGEQEYGEPVERAVFLLGLTPPPHRVTSFPDAGEAPKEIAVLLRSPKADAGYIRAVGGPP